MTTNISIVLGFFHNSLTRPRTREFTPSLTSLSESTPSLPKKRVYSRVHSSGTSQLVNSNGFKGSPASLITLVGRLLEWTSEMASSRALNGSGRLVRRAVKPCSISDAFPRSGLFGTLKLEGWISKPDQRITISIEALSR